MYDIHLSFGGGFLYTESRDLIRKLTGSASEYEAEKLKRQVYVQGRIKTMNESIFYTVDEIHAAITGNHQIRFEYLRWNLNKELEPRKKGLYDVSPWALTWDAEYNYLIAYDAETSTIRHYRVDKMRKLSVIDKPRAGKERFRAFDLAAYAKKTFGMFNGEETRVKIRFQNEMVGMFIDRFGKDIPIHAAGEEGWSETIVNVSVSDQFIGWIFALGTGVKVVEPESVVSRIREEFQKRIDFCYSNR